MLLVCFHSTPPYPREYLSSLKLSCCESCCVHPTNRALENTPRHFQMQGYTLLLTSIFKTTNQDLALVDIWKPKQFHTNMPTLFASIIMWDFLHLSNNGVLPGSWPQTILVSYLICQMTFHRSIFNRKIAECNSSIFSWTVP